jgi:DNA-binding CsgD family transcriptional regulator
MADERFDKLTDRQKACLRKVSELRVACEIAGELGTSEAMVNKLIKEACEKIGVNRRKEAARLFADFEARQGVPKLDVYIRDLGGPPPPSLHETSPDRRVRTPMVQEARASFEGDLDKGLPTLLPLEEDIREKAKAGLELSFKITAVFAMICLAALVLSKLARTIEALRHLGPR